MQQQSSRAFTGKPWKMEQCAPVAYLKDLVFIRIALCVLKMKMMVTIMLFGYK